MKSLPQILPLVIIVIGILMVIAPTSMLIFWISMCGISGIFAEFNFIYVVAYISIVIVGIFLVRRGLVARRVRR
jgi:hypothetical protein